MIGLDKITHVFVSFTAHTTFTAIVNVHPELGIRNAALIAIIPALAIGLVKEFVDYLRYNGPSRADMGANVLGVSASLGIMYLLGR